MVPEGPPRGNYSASWLGLCPYHNKLTCLLNIMKSYRIEGHCFPIYTFKEVANIKVVVQPAQLQICNKVVFGDC